MFLLVLLLSRACAEWVEISQQHYRKPVRINFNVPTLITENYQPTKAVYTNETIQDHIWNKGHINKVKKHGSIQRVQLESNAVKAPSLRLGSLTNGNDPFRYTNQNDFKEASDVPVKTKYEDYNLDTASEFETHLNKPIEENNNPAYEISGQSEKNTKTVLSRDRNNPSIDNIKRHGQVSSSKSINKHINTVPLTSSVLDIFTNTKRVKTPASDSVRVRNDSNKSTHDSKLSNDDNEKDKQKTVSEQDSTGPVENNKDNAIENLIKFAKIVTDTIRKNTHRTVKSKTTYLENLKESILANIEARIDAAWPDDTPSRQRQRRSSRAAPRGHVQIPSSESALMTISFLTFAVFLIKLVLQLIQTYKNKTMMVTPTVVATVGRAAATAAKKLGTFKPIKDT